MEKSRGTLHSRLKILRLLKSVDCRSPRCAANASSPANFRPVSSLPSADCVNTCVWQETKVRQVVVMVTVVSSNARVSDEA